MKEGDHRNQQDDHISLRSKLDVAPETFSLGCSASISVQEKHIRAQTHPLVRVSSVIVPRLKQPSVNQPAPTVDIAKKTP